MVRTRNHEVTDTETYESGSQEFEIPAEIRFETTVPHSDPHEWEIDFVLECPDCGVRGVGVRDGSMAQDPLYCLCGEPLEKNRL